MPSVTKFGSGSSKLRCYMNMNDGMKPRFTVFFPTKQSFFFNFSRPWQVDFLTIRKRDGKMILSGKSHFAHPIFENSIGHCFTLFDPFRCFNVGNLIFNLTLQTKKIKFRSF